MGLRSSLSSNSQRPETERTPHHARLDDIADHKIRGHVTHGQQDAFADPTLEYAEADCGPRRDDAAQGGDLTDPCEQCFAHQPHSTNQNGL